MPEPSSDVANDDSAPTVEDWQIQRDAYKISGDQAFRVGGYRTAIDQYSKAISLDPFCVILFSNRSAAYLSNGESSKALKDARKCVELDPSFTKGHSRLAAALLKLKRFEQAKDCYEHVLEKDRENVAGKRGLSVCIKEISERMTLEQQRQQDIDEINKEQEEEPHQKEEPGEGDDDDLLNDFFNEVEEVVTKKIVETQTKINAIKNDRKTLGSTQDQINRLLQPRYEWRNLNPFYVLQLPAATVTNDDISRRYKALSLLLHPDKNHANLISDDDRHRAQRAYDQVQTAKTLLADENKKRYTQSLIEEGMKHGEIKWKQHQKDIMNKAENIEDEDSSDMSLEAVKEREVMRIFANVEMKRRDVEDRERNFEQRERQQEDDQVQKERNERKFDKQWRKEERVDKRVGNWRDFNTHKKSKT